MELNKNYEAKVEQVAVLEYYLTRFNCGIKGLELSPDGNTVTILYNGGTMKRISIEADGDLAIFKDIARGIGY